MRIRIWESVAIAVTLSAASASAQSMPQPTSPAVAMAADAHPSFEVATIKPSKPDETSMDSVPRDAISRSKITR